jgi:hypothetical protein
MLRVMQRWLLAIAFLAAGCKSEEVSQLEQVKREMCACKTVACGEEAKKKLPKEGHTSAHREQQLAKDIMNCLAKLYVDERPDTDPDRPSDGSSDGSGAQGSGGSAAPKQ